MINPLHEYVCLYTAPMFDWSDTERVLHQSWLMPTVISDLGDVDRSNEVLSDLRQIMDGAAKGEYVEVLERLRGLKNNFISAGLRTLLDWEISQRAYLAVRDYMMLKNHAERYKGGWTANRIIQNLEGPKRILSAARLSSPSQIEAAFKKGLSKNFDDIADFSLHCISGDRAEVFLTQAPNKCRVVFGSVEDIKNICPEFEDATDFADFSKRYKRLDLSKHMARQKRSKGEPRRPRRVA